MTLPISEMGGELAELQAQLRRRERELELVKGLLECYAHDLRSLLDTGVMADTAAAVRQHSVDGPEVEIETGELCAMLAWRSGKESAYCVRLRTVADKLRMAGTSDDPMLEEIVAARNEWFNGQGRIGLAGAQIPLSARIYALVEYVVPLIDPNSCRYQSGPPLTFREVGELLRRVAGRQFDPELVAVLSPEIERLMRYQFSA